MRGMIYVLYFIVAAFAVAAEPDYLKELDIRTPRVIEDKLYDFGHLKTGSTAFKVSGILESSDQDETILKQPYTKFVTNRDMVDAAIRSGNSTLMLEAIAATQSVEKMTVGQYLAMSSSFRMYFVAIPQSNTVRVRNTGAIGLVPGNEVTLTAVRIGFTYDMGKPLDGDLFKYTEILRLTERGLVKYPVPDKAKLDEALEKRTRNRLDFIRKQAESGSSVFQHRLGLAYLNGEGTEKDEKEARKWFEKAAAQDSKEAKAQLEKMADEQAK